MGIGCKSHIFWNPEISIKLATDVAMVRLEAAANYLAEKTRTNLDAIVKHGPGSERPVYKRGKYAGKWWTARNIGLLRHSIRVVRNPNRGSGLNIWVMVGNRQAYWATMFEKAADPSRGKKFFRPAIAASKPAMKAIFEKGV